jgi:Mrp family chromosome partitioning ATPase
MSRIDEALNMTSGAVARRKGMALVGDSRRIERTTFDDYPKEASEVILHVPPSVGGQTSETRVRVVQPPQERPIPLRVYDDISPSARAEYARLAVALEQARSNRAVRSVMVASALPGEGRTETVWGLARALAGSHGRRVLVVDADVRQPTLHERLGLDNDRGLIECLLGDATVHAPIPIVPVTPTIDAICAGRPSADALGALASGRLERLLGECLALFDWVLLDTPPVQLLPDAARLARSAQGVVFVIGRRSPFTVVERAMTELGRDRIIGTALLGLEQGPTPSNTRDVT